MLLIYNNPATLAAMSEGERDGLMREVDAIVTEPTESGE
jgi:hypothetical protein